MASNDDCSEPIDAMEEQEQFIRAFIAAYRDLPVLWDSTNVNYRNRMVRQESYQKLVDMSKQYVPDAEDGYVKMRIDSLRSAFRREYYKIHKRKGYKPSLWYFNLLTFLAGDDEKIAEANLTDTEPLKTSTVKLGFWTREYSAFLIDIFKKYRCVYIPKYTTHKYKTERDKAIRKITEELMTKTNRKFREDDVRRKIQMLRGQFRLEYSKVKASQERGDKSPYRPSLWCYDLMKFLSDTIVINTRRQRRKTERTSSTSDDNSADDQIDYKMDLDDDHDQDEDEEEDSDSENNRVVPNNTTIKTRSQSGDIYETIARNVAHKMQDMTESQRNIAQRILNDLMYHGQMEELTPKSRLTLD